MRPAAKVSYFTSVAREIEDTDVSRPELADEFLNGSGHVLAVGIQLHVYIETELP
jgi:hypothetical protein